MNTKKITQILDVMDDLFGDYPTTELNYETPFQCLIAVMMSAQTTDKQVNKVTEHLFKVVQWPEDVVKMWVKEFGQAIRTIGLWKGKAKNIVATAGMLLEKWNDLKETTLSPSSTSPLVRGDNSLVYESMVDVYEKHGYVIPDTIDEMVKLPGVWIKTAKVVLYVLYRQRWVAVDTHVHRVMNRLDVVHTKTPEQTSKQLENIIPDEYKDIAHHTIIYFGRYLCIARKPQCERCPFTKICGWYRENKQW